MKSLIINMDMAMVTVPHYYRDANLKTVPAFCHPCQTLQQRSEGTKINVTVHQYIKKESESMNYTSVPVSPVGRHQLEDWNHYVMFVVHDVSALFSLVTFAILFALDRKHPLHPILGRISALCFIVATYSGFSLVSMLRDDTLQRMTPKLLNQYTLITQGFCVAGLLVDGILDQLIPQFRKYSYVYIIYHLFAIAMGLRSMKFLLCVIFQIGEVDTSPYFWAVSFELLFILTIPQLLVDSLYVAMHWRQFQLLDLGFDAPYAKFLWSAHHQMTMVLMACVSSIGLMFTVAHDKYWIFSKPVESIFVRLFIIITPFALFLLYNRHLLWTPIKYHLFYDFRRAATEKKE